MKKMIGILCLLMMVVPLLMACNQTRPENYMIGRNPGTEALQHPEANKTPQTAADAIQQSYYAGQAAPAFEYFQKSSIQRFLTMWVNEETDGEIAKPVWDLDSFTQIVVLDHDFAVSRPDEKLYYCTFSDGGERYGYIIVKYDEKGPAMGNWGVTETTPMIYDLRANMKEIIAALEKTDIDLLTAKATRVYLFDRENSRADQVIRFTDGKGDNYIFYLGDSTFTIEKW